MNRRTDLDLLRVVLCASVIIQHAVLIFASEPRYRVKSDLSPAWATALYEALRIFAMPPFFALAGWAALTSLRRRDVPRFLRDRSARLLPPLAIGIFLFGPFIKYIELSQGRDLGLAGFRLVQPIQIGILEFLPRYFTRIVLTTWSHLWFLGYLAIYSIALLPFLAWLAGRKPIAAPAPWWSVYLPALPLALVLAVFNGYWPYLPNLIHDWSNFAYFALCFLMGATIAAWPRYEDAMSSHTWWLVLLAAVGFYGVVHFGESVSGRLCVGLMAWGCIGGTWGLARRWAPAPSRWLDWLGEATFPIYILHHLPLLGLALWIIPMGQPVWLQVGLITGGDMLVTMALYVGLIRPWPWMRILFGMAPKTAGQ